MLIHNKKPKDNHVHVIQEFAFIWLLFSFFCTCMQVIEDDGQKQSNDSKYIICSNTKCGKHTTLNVLFLHRMCKAAQRNQPEKKK